MARTSSVKVKELREALELSQAQFADKLHYKQAQVSKVESGAAFASEDFAAGLDRVAGTPGCTPGMAALPEQEALTFRAEGIAAFVSGAAIWFSGYGGVPAWEEYR
ncbi:helix-turn-helix transcriptional regulator [Streptomyces albidoflavus]|uniref:helix-turn-helix domain-containing protein n=1 Tax=Streptomyces albidoflavus TaxID=1886 RepID=UPI00340EDFA4